MAAIPWTVAGSPRMAFFEEWSDFRFERTTITRDVSIKWLIAWNHDHSTLGVRVLSW